MMTIVPAYGRDYRSGKEAIEAWKGGDDFIINDISSPWDGKPVNIADKPAGDIRIRFNKLRKVVVVK